MRFVPVGHSLVPFAAAGDAGVLEIDGGGTARVDGDLP